MPAGVNALWATQDRTAGPVSQATPWLTLPMVCTLVVSLSSASVASLATVTGLRTCAIAVQAVSSQQMACAARWRRMLGFHQR